MYLPITKNAIKFYEKLGYHTRGLINIKKLNNDNNYKLVIATKDLIVQKWDEEIKKHCGKNLKKNHYVILIIELFIWVFLMIK